MADKKEGPPWKIIPGSIVKGTGGGYMVCQTEPIHPRAITLKDHTCKYVYVHRVVLENKLGRMVSDDQASQIDHLDKDRANNDPSNLELTSLGSHQKEHSKTNHFWKTSPRNKKRTASVSMVQNVLKYYFRNF
jgi:hypothetical protein